MPSHESTFTSHCELCESQCNAMQLILQFIFNCVCVCVCVCKLMYYTIYNIFTTFLILSRDCLLLLDLYTLCVYMYTYMYAYMCLVHVYMYV